jgi:hypothetical protein
MRAAHQDIAYGAADKVALKARGCEYLGKISNGSGNAHHTVKYSGTGG